MPIASGCRDDNRNCKPKIIISSSSYWKGLAPGFVLPASVPLFYDTHSHCLEEFHSQFKLMMRLKWLKNSQKELQKTMAFWLRYEQNHTDQRMKNYKRPNHRRKGKSWWFKFLASMMSDGTSTYGKRDRESGEWKNTGRGGKKKVLPPWKKALSWWGYPCKICFINK